MSAADFLFSPEVQKLLKVVFAEPGRQFSVSDLAGKTKLSAADVERTQEHLIDSGVLSRCAAKDEEAAAVVANASFIFYKEFRAIALKSFAATEPVRAMLRSKFKDSVMRAFILGEDPDAIVELLVVHGQSMPDEAAMAAACRKLSASTGRHFKVHVMSGKRFASLGAHEGLGRKLAEGAAIEVIREGDTKAKPATEREGLFESAKRRFVALAG